VATLIALWLMAAGHCVGIGIGGTTAVRNRSVFAWSILVTQPAQSCRLLHGRALQCSFTKPAIQALRSISGGQSSAEQDGHMVSALGPSWINITARMITHTLADRRWSWHVQF